MKQTQKIKALDLGFRAHEIRVVTEVLKSGILKEGPKTQEFEKAIAKRVGANFAIAASSGTSALHLAYLALLKPGDEVLVPSFTFFATASMIARSGAKPVFCDIDPKTWTPDAQDAEKRITSKTRAIVGVHLFGNPCEISKFEKLAGKYNLKLIWDAAQSFGTQYHGRDVGSFDDAVCFSFYPTKNLTTGEGGMVVTNDEKLAKKMKLLKSHGESEKYIHTEIGFNYRITELGSAIGISQLKKINKHLKARKKVAAVYLKFFENHPDFQIQKVTPESDHSYNYFSVALRSNQYKGFNRDRLIQELDHLGVPCAVHYPRPLHLQPCFRDLPKVSLPVSEKLASNIIALPLHAQMTPNQAKFVVQAFSKI